MSTMNLMRKAGMLVQDLGGEVLLCSPEASAIHILNPTAQSSGSCAMGYILLSRWRRC